MVKFVTDILLQGEIHLQKTQEWLYDVAVHTNASNGFWSIFQACTFIGTIALH
jgi:hypothetical protein